MGFPAYICEDTKASETLAVNSLIAMAKSLWIPFMLILAGLSTGLCQTVPFRVKTYERENGLAHPTVWSLTRDSTGFLWIGTFDGISRFDGNEFVNYHHMPGDSTSVPPNEIRNLYVDQDNNLWVLNRVVSRFQRSDEKFISYPETASDNAMRKYLLWMDGDELGNIWVLISNSILWYHKSSDRFIPVAVKFLHGDHIELTRANSFVFDHKGTLWISAMDKILRFTTVRAAADTPPSLVQTGSYSVQWNRIHFGLEFQRQMKIIRDEKETYLASNIGLFLLDQSSGRFLPTDKMPGPEMMKEAGNLWWSGRSNPLFFWNEKAGEFQQIASGKILQFETVFIDQDHSVWVSGIDTSLRSTGLMHFIPVRSPFRHYIPVCDGRQSAVYSIYRAPDRSFWVGTKSASRLIHLSEKGQIIKNYPSDFSTKPSGSELKYAAAHVRAIARDNKNQMWFAFFNQYLVCGQEDGHDFSAFIPEFTLPGYEGPYIGYRQLLVLQNGKILAGGDQVSLVIDPESKRPLKIFPFNKVLNGWYASFQDERGQIWTGHGICRILKFDTGFSLLDSVKLGPDPYNIECISGNSDTLWIASMGGGVIRYLTGPKTVTFYTTQNGLKSNYTYHILRDRYHNLWISTNDGLSVLNPKTGIISNFGEPEGMNIREFNADAGFKDVDGTLYFGGMGGFVGFNPDSVYTVKRESSSGSLIITAVTVSGITRSFARAVYDLDTFELSKGDNNICITFVKTDFVNPEQVVYRYQLEGIDQHWTITSSNGRKANYAGLTPGFYRFIVECTDEAGKWSLRKSVMVSVPAYYYQTIWFKLALGLIVFLTLVLLIFLKYQQIRMTNLKRQETLRMQSLQSQLNPHFIFNSLNSISYLISEKPAEIADQYVADFATLMRGFLDHSSRDFVSLSAEIDMIERYLALEHMRLKEKFDYEITSSDEIDPDALEVVPSMIQPFVENAVWHGVGMLKNRKGTIRVSFVPYRKGCIHCVIEDDGIGRKQSALLQSNDYKRRQSKGVSLIIQRIDILNSVNRTSYRVETEDIYPEREETGTRVRVPVTIKSDKYE